MQDQQLLYQIIDQLLAGQPAEAVDLAGLDEAWLETLHSLAGAPPDKRGQVFQALDRFH